MANLVKNVAAGKPLAAGGVYSGPMGTALPTDATTVLDVALKGVGYISDAGVQETIGRDTEKVKAWGGDVVKILQTEHAVTWEYSMIETLRTEVNQEVYGEPNVVVTAATASTGTKLAVKINADTLPHRVRAMEIRDGDARIRIVGPDTQISEVGDVTYADGEVIAYPVTVEGFPDANGNKAYKYTDDGVFSA